MTSFTVVVDVFVNHFHAKNKTKLSQSFQVIRMNNVRAEEVVQQCTQLVHIITRE